MKHRKKIEGLEARRVDYDKMISHMTAHDIPQGFRKPGSIKKAHGKVDKRRGN